jgi:hypothetical protein
MDDFDFLSVRQAFVHEGADPRQWITYGIVEPETQNSHSVLFNDETGAPLPYPLVLVKLINGTTVPCRVGSPVAGEGESEYYPFVAGDEVVVAIVDGNERAGCVILCRLNQGLDTFPPMVGGNDSTTNTFGFRRMRTPYVLETASSYLLRSALTGAFIGIDQSGGVTISGGDGNYLTISPDVIGFQLADTSCSMQIDPSKQQVALQALSSILLLDDNTSSFISGGTLMILTSGGLYQPGHAITFEQVVSLLAGLLTAIGTSIPGPIAGAALAAAAVPIIATPGTGAISAASVLPGDPFTAAIQLALQVPPDPTGEIPGVGRAGTLF